MTPEDYDEIENKKRLQDMDDDTREAVKYIFKRFVLPFILIAGIILALILLG